MLKNISLNTICCRKKTLKEDTPVIPEVILSSEAFPADVTRIWSLVCVCTLVNKQIVRLSEVPAAVLADILFFGPEIYTAINTGINTGINTAINPIAKQPVRFAFEQYI